MPHLFSPDNPCRILLISENETKEREVVTRLNLPEKGSFRVKRFVKLETLKSLELETFCDLALVDLQLDADRLIPFLQWAGNLHSPVPIVAVCEHLGELQTLGQAREHVDDYILLGNAQPDELADRIGQVIRQREKIHYLFQEQDLLNTLLDSIPDAVFFKNRNSQFTKVNRMMSEKYGRSLSDLIGKSDFDLFDEAHARPAYSDELEVMKSGKSIVAKIEKEIMPDGKTGWVSTTKMPLKDRGGNTIGTMGVSRDITKLKKTQDELEEERVLLRVIVDHALAGIFYKDTAGRYLIANQKHAEYLDAESPETVVGKTIYDFFPPEAAEVIDLKDRKIMASQTVSEGVLDRLAISGHSDKILLTSKVPLIDSSGTCKGLVGISLDVTKQKENEEALKDAFKALEETKLQLIEAEKLRSVGRMAAGVAHEVKNPLNVISLGLDYLRSEIKETAETTETLDAMISAMNNANQVVSELLDYSAPHDFQMEPVDLNEIFKRSLALLRHSLNHAHIIVECDFSENLPIIEGDPAKIEQALVNLCLNAIHAMASGGTLSLRSYSHRMKSAGSNVSSRMTESFRVGDPIVSLEISDTGHGIDKEHAAKLFDPFFSTKSAEGNTGLGLTVTRNIIEIHRAVITLKNNDEGLGAKATLHFHASD
jgi:PAS domain S-box-containing protein